MSIPDPVQPVLDRLADILENEVVGVKRVYAGRPRDVPPMDFPACIVLSGAGNYGWDTPASGDSLLPITRSYRLLLLVKPWAQGNELEAEQAARPYFQKMLEAFLERDGLGYPDRQSNHLTGVQTARIINDSGIINIVIGNKAYSGIEFGLEVTQYMRVRHVSA